LLAKFRPLAIKFLDYYVIVVVLLSIIWIVAAAIDVLGDAETTTGDKIFSVLFGVLAPAVAFAVSRGVKAELKRAAERKKPEHWRVRFVKYFCGFAAMMVIIPIISSWFEDPTAPLKARLFDLPFMLLLWGVYWQAGVFVIYKVARHSLWLSGVDDK